MAKHSVPHGENGTMTSQTGKTDTYEGRHRDGVAPGTDTQRANESRQGVRDIPMAGHDDH